VKKITIAFAISRKKKLDDVIELFDLDSRVKALHVLGKQNFKLMESEDAQEVITSLKSKKLRPLVLPDNGPENSNIENTLDSLLVQSSELQQNDELLLICGSFFAMTDVREYFGLKEEIDVIKD